MTRKNVLSYNWKYLPHKTHKSPFAVRFSLLLSLSVLLASPLLAQETDPVDVLIVTAHPDDDAMFAASVYAITHKLGGNVDLALITDGSGGFRYADLAEPIYGLDLDNEAVARKHLPAIRKQELMAGGRIIGLRNYFFFDQYDHQFTTNVDTVLQHVWDTDVVRTRLIQILERGDYDYIFAHLPIDEGFHGHHKGATILALQAVEALDAERKPVVLGGFVGSSTDSTRFVQAFEQLTGYPITKTTQATPVVTFDRLQKLDDLERLDYRIVVNWLVAEHKSQGTMQFFSMDGDINLERFWYFAINDPARLAETKALFEQISPQAE